MSNMMKAPSGPEDILPAPAEWWAKLLGQKASTYGGPPLSAAHSELRVCAYMCRRVGAWEPTQRLRFFHIPVFAALSTSADLVHGSTFICPYLSTWDCVSVHGCVFVCGCVCVCVCVCVRQRG